MGLRQKLEERIRKKEQEIREHEATINQARAYIQAMQDTVKLLPRDDIGNGGGAQMLRPGSSAYKAMEAIKATGRPMHVLEILKALGLKAEKKHKLSVGGTLARYARNREVFKKTAPNTFDLLEGNASSEDEPPEGFGIVNQDGEEEREEKEK